MAAEKLTQTLPSAPSGTGLDPFNDVPASSQHVKALATIIVAAKQLRLLEAHRRRVSKGQGLRFDGAEPIAGVNADATLDSAINDFDERVSRTERSWHPFLEILDTRQVDFDRDFAVATLNASAIAPFREGMNPYILVDTSQPLWNLRLARLSHRARHVDVIESNEPIQDASFIASTYVLARACARVFAVQTRPLGAKENGYIILRSDTLHDALEAQIASETEAPRNLLSAHLPSSSDELISILTRQNTSPSTWTGLPLLEIPDHWMINLVAIHLLLERRLRLVQNGGAARNYIGLAFEQAAQLAIDSALGQRPTAKYAQLVGRQLRVGNRSITDVDALIQVNDHIVLVSCKSFGYTTGYDIGDYQSVRSATTRIAEALESWDRRMKIITENPIGSNYDFSDVTVSGMLITPDLFFTDNTFAREKVDYFPNLLTYMSLPELTSSLTKHRTIYRSTVPGQ